YKQTMLFFNGFILYLLMSVIGLTNPTFVRLTWYYFIFVALSIPYMLHFIKEADVRIALKSFIAVYFSMVFFRLLIVYDDGDMMPYKTILQAGDRNGRFQFMEYRGKDGRMVDGSLDE
ncbi:MAG: hypothetical protein EOP49_18735, partial [Sphingobacteriales bacterium]